MDTIAAIATPIGQSAIGIIKLSGPAALEIVQKIYRRKKDGKRLTTVSTHTIHYGHIIDPQGKKKIDEVLVSIMRKPHSYTREDVIEINCHGGKICLYKVLELVLQQGARLAEPGEFTKRAFLNGRIDLAQAEAVIDLINTQSVQGLSFLVNTLDGKTFHSLYTLHQEICKWETLIETELNFTGEVSFRFSKKELLDDINRWCEVINRYICSYKTSNILVNGLRVAIAGKTNVGKSSLMNRLLQKKRSIVTNIPGTTTDIIEDSFALDGILIRLFDTAGFCKSRNEIEEEGIQLTRQSISQADVIMAVLDGSQDINEDDKYVLDLVCRHNKPFFIVLNKADLGVNLQDAFLLRFIKRQISILRVSALSGKGISKITHTISLLCLPDHKDTFTIGVNLRQKHILLQIKKSFLALKDLIQKKLPEELLAEEFRNLSKLFNQFRGRQYSEDILDQIFTKFCIGK